MEFPGPGRASKGGGEGERVQQQEQQEERERGGCRDGVDGDLEAGDRLPDLLLSTPEISAELSPIRLDLRPSSGETRAAQGGHVEAKVFLLLSLQRTRRTAPHASCSSVPSVFFPLKFPLPPAFHLEPDRREVC